MNTELDPDSVRSESFRKKLEIRNKMWDLIIGTVKLSYRNIKLMKKR